MTRRAAWLVAAAVAVVVVLGVSYAMQTPSERPFREYVAQLRAAGRLTSIDEYLGAAPEPSDNAADAVMASPHEMRAAFRAGVAGPWATDNDPERPWFETTSAERLQALGVYLDEVAPFFDRLETASRLHHLRVSVGPELTATDPLVPALQSALYLLSARAYAGTTSDARLRSIETTMRLSLLCGGVTVERMVGLSMMEGAVAPLRRECVQTPSDAAALRGRFDALLAESRLPSFPDAARVELATWIHLFDRLLAGESCEVGGVRLAYGSAATRADHSLVPRWFRSDNSAVESPAEWAEACGCLEDLAALDARSYPSLRRAIARRLADAPKFERLLAFSLPGMAEQLARTDAVTHLARVGLAAAEFRAAHGDFPATLDELKPMFADGVPLDPFTDAPFAYERTAVGARIASQGRLADEAPLDEATLREKCLLWELKR